MESILLNWNIEELNQGNSIFFLVSIKDRSVEIRSGFNLKYIIQDRHIQGIIDKIIIPEFERRNFYRGILLGTRAIITKIDNPYYNLLPNPEHLTWESQTISECRVRNPPGRNGYSNCPVETSYHGGGGNWRSRTERQAIDE